MNCLYCMQIFYVLLLELLALFYYTIGVKSEQFDDSRSSSISDIISKLSINGVFQTDPNDAPPFLFNSENRNGDLEDHHITWINSADVERRIVKRAMDTYHKKTCVKFVSRSTESDFLRIYKDLGCYSMVGRTSGAQDLSLGRGCVYHEIVVHELMHAVGFWHEQSRADRDDFVTVRWENIVRGMEGQFNKIDLAYTDYLGESYDYFSVMHYDSRAFSKNGQSTIEAVKLGMTQVLGKALDLSEIDLRKVMKICVIKLQDNLSNDLLLLCEIFN